MSDQGDFGEGGHSAPTSMFDRDRTSSRNREPKKGRDKENERGRGEESERGRGEESERGRDEENERGRSQEDQNTKSGRGGRQLDSLNQGGGLPFVRVEGSREEFGRRQVTYQGQRTFRSPPDADQDKTDVAYRFREEVNTRLDQFRNNLKLHGLTAINKSEIVEGAVERVLRDWELNGYDGWAVEWLKTRLEISGS